MKSLVRSADPIFCDFCVSFYINTTRKAGLMISMKSESGSCLQKECTLRYVFSTLTHHLASPNTTPSHRRDGACSCKLAAISNDRTPSPIHSMGTCSGMLSMHVTCNDILLLVDIQTWELPACQVWGLVHPPIPMEGIDLRGCSFKRC